MERLLNLSYEHKLSHLGSCITVLPILEEIYNNKMENDIVVLSSGHAGLAQYVVIEEKSNGKINAEDLLNDMGIHPVRDPKNGIHVSTGSLGCGILVAVGLALADKNKNIYCVISDGECAEGSVWEALSFCNNHKLTNLIIHVNINGYSAYDSVDREYLENKLKVFLPSIIIHQTKNPDFLGGLNAHYCKIKNVDEIKMINKTLEV